MPIKEKIEKAIGEPCWFDLDGIESDATFTGVIMHAIEEASIFLFMYSRRHSQISDYETDWTIRELNYAQVTKKRIVFVNVDKTPLVNWFIFMFGQKQQVDATSPDRLNKLIEDIKKWLADPLEDKQLYSAGDVIKQRERNRSSKVQEPFLLLIEDTFGIKGRGVVVTGIVARGRISVGDEVEILGDGEKRKAVCAGIEMDEQLFNAAEVGDQVGLLLQGVEINDVHVNQMLVQPS